jgi:hypothetical protein
MKKEHTPEKKTETREDAPFREEALHPKEPAKGEEKEKKDVKRK